MRIKTRRDIVSVSKELHLTQLETKALQRALQIVDRMRDYVEPESDIDYVLAGAEHGLRATIDEVPIILEYHIVMPSVG